MLTVKERLEAVKPEIVAMVKDMHDNPELGHQEFHAMQLQAALLEKYGFTVEKGVADVKTAYIAKYKGAKEGPKIGYLAEYDALPGLGHACGHNMIAGVACAAAIALKDAVDEYGGEVWVVGAPAEETDGGKVYLVKAGCYDPLDAALMAHPAECWGMSGNMYAIEPLQFEFFGKAAHAAAFPEDGINALDGVLQLFTAVNALREHLRDSVRIHGIVKQGGEAANIVPEYACAQFYARAESTNYLREVVEKLKRCGEGAAACTGTTVKITNFENPYDNMMSNDTMSDRATEYLYQMGIPRGMKRIDSSGSSDVGSVSQKCPTIHAWFCATDGNENIKVHTPDFPPCTISEAGTEAMMLQTAALVMTGEDLLSDPGFLAAATEEYERKLKEV